MAARSNFATSSRGTARSSCTHSSHGRLSTLPMLHASTRQGISQIKCTKVRIKENAQNEHCARPIEVVNRSSPLVFAAPIIRVHLRPLADLRCMAATFASCTDHAVIDLGRILAACLFVVKLTLAARRHGVPSLVCVLRAHLSDYCALRPLRRCHQRASTAFHICRSHLLDQRLHPLDRGRNNRRLHLGELQIDSRILLSPGSATPIGARILQLET